MARNRNMRLFEASTASPDLTDMIKLIEGNAADQVHAVLEFVRKDVLYFLKSYTDAVVPPVGYQRKFTFDKDLKRIKVPDADRSGWRPAHPGGWGDISGDLKKGYRTDLTFEGGSWKLTIMNTSDHAAYVEAKDGLFVVHGVLEKNGPVEKSIRKALVALKVPWRFIGLEWSIPDTSESIRIGPTRGAAAPPTLVNE